MGIRGLTGFIDKNQGLLQQHELYGCSVVVDGNNFYHYLYQACHVQSMFGGDYDVYRASVASTFQSMKECGITPYVVLDGAYTVDGRKLKTSLSRAVNRIKLVDSVTNGHQGHALPVLAYETFIQVMCELAVPHAMCQFEADSEIATLANQLKCPVISNDSDFYIFDLEYGFLPLDYVDFRPIHKQSANKNAAYSYLHCYKYHVDNFISSYDLKRSNLPILATLLGNDFIDASNFSAFYAKFKVPKVESKKFSLPAKMTKVISVLHWLHTQADDKGISCLRDQILTYIPPHKTSFVRKLFDKAVLGYTEVNTFDGYDLYKFFHHDASSSFNKSPDFCSFSGKHFPLWFVQAVCNGELTSHILNVVILHRVILLTQMESLTLASSYNASYFLRNVLYSILLKDDCCHLTDSSSDEICDLASESKGVNSCKENLCSYQSACDTELMLKVNKENEAGKDNRTHNEEDILSDEEEDESNTDNSEGEINDQDVLVDAVRGKHCTSVPWKQRAKARVVEEYTRMNKQLKKSVIDLTSETDKSNVPGLEEMSSLSPDKKREIMCRAFGSSPLSLKPFPDKLKVFSLCVISWIRSSDPRVTFSQIDSLIISVIFLAVKRELKLRKGKQGPRGKESVSREACSQNFDGLESDSSQKFDFDLVCQESESAHLNSLSASVEKHHKKVPSFNRAHTFNASLCHVFAQLQAIIVDACHLNRLLQQPLPNPRPAELINGTLLYNLTADLSSRSNPELFVSMMFSEKDVASPLRDLYKSLRHFFLEEMSLASFLVHPTQVSGRNKKKRKKTKEQQCVVSKETESDQEDEVTRPQEELSEFAASNKFSLLLLCD
ncbi:protein asteroid homolog 1-like [Elysia marginata]|uniref:Protein asteroid homolog 1-like n=1 Tax=Elysia marginata TaxID=1093978 RepID=A0AAV4JX01_9GAST|nr:protein asteroid homolog 1-like [Elysia marginata]